jgi:hypothetical protein
MKEKEKEREREKGIVICVECLRSSCLSFLSAGIMGMYHYSQP